MLFVVPAAYRTGCAAREMNKGTGMRGESRRGRTVTAAVSAEAVSVGESQSLGRPEKAGRLRALGARPASQKTCLEPHSPSLRTGPLVTRETAAAA